jgi:5-dehydro-2-deoxygluconokinase
MWPIDHVPKVLAYAHQSDAESIWSAQVAEILRLQEACHPDGREYLLELQPSAGKTYGSEDVANLMDRLYRQGIKPDWWKLPPAASERAWSLAGDVIRRHDRWCRGMLVLGQGSAPEQLEAAFEACAAEPYCRGFAVGRSVFLEASTAWLEGRTSDTELVDDVAQRFQWFVATWEGIREQRRESGRTG